MTSDQDSPQGGEKPIIELGEEKATFSHPAMENVRCVLAELDIAEAQVKALKQKLVEAVTDLPSKIGENEDLREEIANYLYWFEERIPANVLKEAFDVVSPAHVKKKRNNGLKYPYIEVPCYDCKQPFLTKVTSRSVLKVRGWNSICESCQEKRSLSNQQYFEQIRRREEAHQQRVQELRTMPYREYLQTPEWQERRKRAMKKAGFRCQVCNAYGVRLNAHHRTYVRRGGEWDSDLITLCEVCHQVFHDNGKLAQ